MRLLENGSSVAWTVKNLTTIQETGLDPWVRKIPGVEEPGGLLSMGSQRVGHD